MRVEPFDSSLINFDVVCTRRAKLRVCSTCIAAPNIARRECAVQCAEAALTGGGLSSSAILSCASSVLPPMCGVKIVLGMPVGQCKNCDHFSFGAEPGVRPQQMCVADERGKGGRDESCTYARAATAGRLLMRAHGAGRDNGPQEDSDKAVCQSPASGV